MTNNVSPWTNMSESSQRRVESDTQYNLFWITDLQGNCKFWSSAGNLGFKNSRKSTSYAAQAVAEKVATHAFTLGYDSVIVKLKGLGYGKLSATRALYKSKLSVTKIIELTPIAHNGCRPPKKRRV